jgi:ribonuclease HI
MILLIIPRLIMLFVIISSTYNQHGGKLKVVSSQKLLGITLKENKSVIEHVYNVRNKVDKALNVLHTLRNLKRENCLRIGKALVNGIIDYGLIVSGFGPKETLKKINSGEMKMLKIATGAFNITKDYALKAEVGYIDLEHRRDRDIISNNFRLMRDPQSKFGMRIKEELYNPRNYNISYMPLAAKYAEIIKKYEMNDIEVWKKETNNKYDAGGITINRTIHDKYKSQQNRDFEELSDILKNVMHRIKGTTIYTDGSVKDNSAGAGIYIENNEEISIKLKEGTSSKNAELFAIQQAVRISANRGLRNINILTDSLHAINEISCALDKTNELAKNIHRMATNKGILLNVIWLPKALQVAGNVKADELARKASTSQNFSCNKLTLEDIKKVAAVSIRKEIEEKWSKEKHKLFIGKTKEKYFTKRNFQDLTKKEESVVTRLLLGYSRYSHGHIINKYNPPHCDCDEPINSEHIFECIFFINLRHSLNVEPSYLSKNNNATYKKLLKYLKLTRYFFLI